MKKFVLLLIALAVAPWARTWEDAEAFDYRAWFEDDSLGTQVPTGLQKMIRWASIFMQGMIAMTIALACSENTILLVSGMTRTIRAIPSGSRNTGWTTASGSLPSS